MLADKLGNAGVLSWEGGSEDEKGRMLALTACCDLQSPVDLVVLDSPTSQFGCSVTLFRY